MDCCENCKHVLIRDIEYGGERYTMCHCNKLNDILTVCDMRLVEHEILVRKSVRPDSTCDLYEEFVESSNDCDEIRETEN
jgi:hypothetical protein